MIQFNRFYGGVPRAVTFSYDDGQDAGDERLVKLFNDYGVKATFHLNGKNYVNNTPQRDEELRRRYAGHEIACHTLSHGRLTNMAPICAMNEILEDRRILERIARYPVVGMSYPSGSHSRQAEAYLQAAGILYSRTIEDTGWFCLPENFLTWHPTCHHRNALPLCERFMDMLDSEWCDPLFYIWGHSHELRTEDDWDAMKRIVDKLAGSDKIWYATNLEIYRYLQAVNSLAISADERILHNPSALTVWVEKDKTEVLCIQPGETIYLK